MRRALASSRVTLGAVRRTRGRWGDSSRPWTRRASSFGETPPDDLRRLGRPERDFFRFDVIHESKRSRARVGEIRTPHGVVRTPGFVSVGTNAALKAVHHETLDAAGLDLMFANTYHLMLQPGAETVEALGGVHEMMGRRRPTITDSGGFQVFSLGTPERRSEAKELKSRNPTKHRRENLLLEVSEEGAMFRSYRDGTKMTLTPESSVAAQKAIGADIIIPLDELPPYDIDNNALRESVARSHRWMTRSLRAHLSDVRQQAMYGVVHGGVDRDLRRASVEYLSALPFDGMAIGGSLGRDSTELGSLLEFLMPLMPKDMPNHLLGISDVENVDRAVMLGVDTFDSAYTTQVARHGTLFTHSRGRINFRRAEFRRSREPACHECDCTLCSKHSLGYLHHLDRANEPLAWTLASEHNLFYMGQKMARVRERILNDEI
jgi:queuine tRNA-ribosyltransferase